MDVISTALVVAAVAAFGYFIYTRIKKSRERSSSSTGSSSDDQVRKRR